MAEATKKSVITASSNAASTNGHTSSVSSAQPRDEKPALRPALQFDRFFSKSNVSPYDEVQWERRTASITDASGKSIFEQKDVEVPVDWSMTATNIVASKYLHGLMNTPERESGVRALIGRVAETIRDWGLTGGYFSTAEDAAVFHDELVHLLVTQKVAFNSPVWFNVGCDRLEPNSDAQNWHWNPHTCAVEFSVTGYRTPQCSACFINAVDDSLDSILTLAKTEGMLFKWGSGTGTNLSSIRGSMELLSGGGTASGPLSFMRGFDAFAGVIKSGGKTRRAAKMVILNVDHPDILDFVECKMKEEAKAWALMREGYDGSSGPDSEAYSSIFFQNANNSVRVTDEFMSAVEKDGEFATYTVKDHTLVKKHRARDIMYKIAEATWQCGDPGMQYDTTINRWHTSKNTARINASNPCSEYMFLDNSACNLASFNLLKFVTAAGTFNIEAYRAAIDIMITAMDILIDNSGYPTESIARNSHDYRPLGLGYANLGALLMAFGLPYDSDAGRDFAATLTAIMCGEAYLQSARISEKAPALAAATTLAASAHHDGGACPGFYVNREPFLDVIRMHRAEVNNIGKSKTADDKTFAVPQLEALIAASKDCWDKALAHGEKYGYRNSQVTVLAPTGTIGFMMDCDTTGIEPDLALVKYKKLVGGGMIKIVNNTVPAALFKLGYNNDEVDAIVSFIDATGTIEGAPGIKPEHLAVFDCSFKPSKGTRSIHYMGHVKMMAATQPFLSGAISKTVNLPHDCSIDDVADAYMESWRLGLKAVAVYRDGSKGAQPLNVSDGKGAKAIKGASSDETVTAAADRVLAALSTGKAAAESDVKTLEAKISDKIEVTAKSIVDATTAFTTSVKSIAALSAATRSDSPSAKDQDQTAPPRAVRHRLPEERASLTHKFGLAGHEGYITVGLYPNGQPGEIFIKMAKEGSTVSGLMDSFATAISLALQHGVPLKVLCEKFAHSRFEPSGWTGNEQIGYAKSIMDYIFRWLQLRFLSGQQLSLFAGLAPATAASTQAVVLSDPADEGKNPYAAPGAYTPEQHSSTRGMGATSAPQGGILPEIAASSSASETSNAGSIEDRGLYHAADAMRSMYDMGDAPSCHTCGAIMVRNGSCYRCMSCGSTSGCS
ncbi:ribonucleoside-diphosphate reductase alpha chain [Silvibacterium bohemicum]|uniref:Vitamin B12-dependent ribonucleotide reductase n=1 Tax=Silvibacterium bohemicum TaxID=1577686 RepID=A0A841JZN7_9BACT|nr:vitamin B12-dependent ribonucleotide reductase [Silvibacterium bohemicum]MBB6145837.1 ribonucleoside-diphosphate reductase alpha chain [Silvibacterium bohemicum]